VTDKSVYGHPEAGATKEGHYGLVPIKIDAITDLSWRIDTAQKRVDELQTTMGKAEADSRKSGSKEQKAAKAYLSSHKSSEDQQELEDLRGTVQYLGKLQEQQKKLKPPAKQEAEAAPAEPEPAEPAEPRSQQAKSRGR